MKELEIFLSSDQTTTCPKCGNRTEMIEESELFQQHKCLTKECNFQFILEFENNSNI